MSISVKDPRELQAIYDRRFKAERVVYRQRLWATLVESFFQPMIPPHARVLGYHTFWLGLSDFDYRSLLVPLLEACEGIFQLCPLNGLWNELFHPRP